MAKEQAEGWLGRDANRAAIFVAKARVAAAERRLRDLNDQMADAGSELKVASVELRRLQRASKARTDQ